MHCAVASKDRSRPAEEVDRLVTDENTELPSVDQRLLKELNDSGYGFQHAVVEALGQFQEGVWSVIDTEYPVANRGRTTDIDVLARCHQVTLMVAECKRDESRLRRLAFCAAAGLASCAWHPVRIHRIAGGCLALKETRGLEIGQWRPVHIGLEVKTKAEGDPKGQARSLRTAITQVQAGTNGLTTLLAQQKQMWGAASVMLLPVIFTTAHLYTTDADLSASDLETRLASWRHGDTRKVGVAGYNVSPELMHELEPTAPSTSLQSLVRDRHARSIAIVSSTAVDRFLKTVADVLYHFFDRR